MLYYTVPYPFFMLWVPIKGSRVEDEVVHFTLYHLDDTIALKLKCTFFQRKQTIFIYLNF